MSAYPIGSRVDISTEFEDSTGAFVDPTDVIFEYKKPDMVTHRESYMDGMGNVTRASAGHYSFQLTLDKPGRWYYKWYGTGTYVGTSGDLYVSVDPTQFGGASGATGP